MDGIDAVVVDGSGDVVAAGVIDNATTLLDFAVVKMAGVDGAEIWRREIDGGLNQYDGSAANQVAVDATGDVLAASSLQVPGPVFNEKNVIKLDGSSGAELWRHGFAANEQIYTLNVDGAGDVFVTGGVGYASNDLLVIKLDGATGGELWRREIDGSANTYDVANAAAVLSSGDVVVVGQVSNIVGFSDSDFAVLRLAGATGADVWRADLSGTAGVSLDYAMAIAVDGAGNVLAAGRMQNNVTETDFAAVKLSGATGAEIWRTSIDSGEFYDTANRIVADNAGNALVVGRIGGFTGLVKLASATGAELWRRQALNESAAPMSDAAGDVIVPLPGLFGLPNPCGVQKLSGATGNTVWEQTIHGTLLTTLPGSCPVAVIDANNDVIAGGSVFNNVTAFDIAIFKLDGTDGTVGPLKGRNLLVKDRDSDPSKRKIVAVIKDSATTAPAPTSPDNPMTAGAKLSLVNPSTTESATFTLPSGSLWKGLGNPAGSKGYKYRDAAGTNGPCKLLLVKPHKLIKAVCLGKLGTIPYTLDEVSQASLTISVQFGTADPQCANFGGTVRKNEGTGLPGSTGLYKAKNAPPFSGDCPLP